MKFTKLMLIGMTCFFCFSACSDEEVVAAGKEETPETGTEMITVPTKRLLWASINGLKNATANKFVKYNNRILQCLQ